MEDGAAPGNSLALQAPLGEEKGSIEEVRAQLSEEKSALDAVLAQASSLGDEKGSLDEKVPLDEKGSVEEVLAQASSLGDEKAPLDERGPLDAVLAQPPSLGEEKGPLDEVRAPPLTEHSPTQEGSINYDDEGLLELELDETQYRFDAGKQGTALCLSTRSAGTYRWSSLGELKWDGRDLRSKSVERKLLGRLSLALREFSQSLAE